MLEYGERSTGTTRPTLPAPRQRQACRLPAWGPLRPWWRLSRVDVVSRLIKWARNGRERPGVHVHKLRRQSGRHGRGAIHSHEHAWRVSASARLELCCFLRSPRPGC
eukprot:scaffold133_cov407-Prasinococcus_capsulatus_cf.AAC.7